MKIEYILSKEVSKKGTGMLCNSSQTLNNFFMCNEKIEIKDGKITVDSYTASYNIECGEVEASKEKYFIIKIANENNKDKEDIKCLEVISKELRRAVKVEGFDFKLNILWDDISNYYRKLSYPLISNVENLMRKLITQFMIKKIGTDWVKKALPEPFKNHIEQRNKVEDTIENLLYEADFIELSTFLFTPYSELNAEKELFQKIKSIDLKSNIEDQINDILKLEPKSNWARFFTEIEILKNVSSEGLEKEWKKLYKIRNKVAHNKLFNVDDYNTLLKSIEKIEKKIQNALDNIDKIDVPDEQKETVAKVAVSNSLKNKYSYLDEKINFRFNDTISSIMPAISKANIYQLDSNINKKTLEKLTSAIQMVSKANIPLDYIYDSMNTLDSFTKIIQVNSPEISNDLDSEHDTENLKDGSSECENKLVKQNTVEEKISEDENKK